MLLSWPMVFVLLGFGSIAYSKDTEEFRTRRIIEMNLDETPDSGSGTSEAPQKAIISGFNVNTGTFGSGTNTATETGFRLQPPGGGFDVATGTFGRGVPERSSTNTTTGTGFRLQPPEGGFDVGTGTFGAGMPEQNTRRPLMFQEAIPCHEKLPEPKITYRSDSWIFHNYVPMSTKVSRWESVTYVTHARWFDLIHISPLVERWRAPVSVAVSISKDNFEKTLDSIRYLRSCTSPLVSLYVTFHLYFLEDYVPDNIFKGKMILSVPYDCRLASPLKDHSEAREEATSESYYPNLGRNIARENALTHYHIVANIDTYPSANLASDFLEMIERDNRRETSTTSPRVFVLPAFEVVEGETVPFNKTELIKMLNEGKAVPLPDKDRCPLCQNMPDAAAWRSRPESDALSVFSVGKRTGTFKSWEPIFIGTNKEPMYYEAFTEETTHDRRVQGWVLCRLDYDFLILDNAFVVRPPGTVDIGPFDEDLRSYLDGDISNEIITWYRKFYGDRRQCAV